jgi:hypothetical protein
MPRSDGRVRPGQKIDTAFSARAWNRAQDAADIVLKDRLAIAVPEKLSRPRSLVVPMRLAEGSPAVTVGNVVTYETDTGLGFRELSDGMFAVVECVGARLYEAIGGDSTTYPYGRSFGVAADFGNGGDVIPVIVAGYAVAKINVLVYAGQPFKQYARPAVWRTGGPSQTQLDGCLEGTDCGCEGAAKVLFYGGEATTPNNGIASTQIVWGAVVL